MTGVRRTIIPEARYHPTIKIYQDEDRKSSKTSMNQYTETRSAVIHKAVMPKAKYHPTIHVQSDEDRGSVEARASSNPIKRSSAVNSGRAGIRHAEEAERESHNDSYRKKPEINPEPATRPCTYRENQQRSRAQNATERDVSAATQRGSLNHPHLSKASANPTVTMKSKSSQTRSRPNKTPSVLEVMPVPVDVEEVEKTTRGQSTNDAWFAWRKNRITASITHKIAHSRFVNGGSNTPPASYLAAISGSGPSLTTRAMQWGIDNEAKAIDKYKVLKTRSLGYAVTVEECGLFIDKERPWLAATPDGIVRVSAMGKRMCLEVKCPYSHKDRTVEEACRTDRNFCLEIQNEPPLHGEAPIYRLKPSHAYYTQIQCQLAVTRLKQADLVVYTLKETAIVPVTFDPEMWEDTLSKLETFYRDAYLPYICRKHPDAVAAFVPEQ